MLGEKDIKGMMKADRKFFNFIQFHLFYNKIHGLIWQFQSSQLGLNGDLPTTCRAEIEAIPAITYMFAGPIRETRVICDPPEKDMRVKQQPH